MFEITDEIFEVAQKARCELREKGWEGRYYRSTISASPASPSKRGGTTRYESMPNDNSDHPYRMVSTGDWRISAANYRRR